MKEKTWIGLLDCNNFFVSCERLFSPNLIDKPTVVLSSNDGCVIARSDEVKDIGVPMGVPYFKIKDTLKKHGVTTLSSHLTLYRDISSRVFSVMKEELGNIEQYSIDEAFFSVQGSPYEIVESLKNVIERRVGIPVSIGVASTKTQAKYANKLAKEGTGIKVIDASEWNSFSPNIPIQQVWGVGGKTELKYKKYGIDSVAKLVSTDTSSLNKLFGIAGVRLQQELSGKPVYQVLNRTEIKQSILSSRSFKNETKNYEVLADALAYHVRNSMADLRSMQCKTAKISVSIRPNRHGNFLLRGGSRETFLDRPSNDTFVVLKSAKRLLRELYELGVPYKKVGITLSKFTQKGVEQGDLFETETTVRSEGLMEVVDTLNAKQNKDVLLIGSRLKAKDWRPASESRSPAYTTDWKEIMVAKA